MIGRVDDEPGDRRLGRPPADLVEVVDHDHDRVAVDRLEAVDGVVDRQPTRQLQIERPRPTVVEVGDEALDGPIERIRAQPDRDGIGHRGELREGGGLARAGGGDDERCADLPDASEQAVDALTLEGADAWNLRLGADHALA